MPFQASPLTPVPTGWQAAFGRLRLTPDARVLVVPIPILRCTAAMRWQADTGVPGSLIGGYFLGPDQTGQATFSPGPTTLAARYLDQLWEGGTPSGSSFTAQLRSDLAYWRPAAIVAVTSVGSPLEHVLAALVGPPTFRVARVLVWRLQLVVRTASQGHRGQAGSGRPCTIRFMTSVEVMRWTPGSASSFSSCRRW
jgi:hypothetical protein